LLKRTDTAKRRANSGAMQWSANAAAWRLHLRGYGRVTYDSAALASSHGIHPCIN
jgi:hypothetical protein